MSKKTKRPVRRYVAPPGTHGAGLTNDDALGALRSALGAPLQVGGLYRVMMMQGELPSHEVGFIGEYAGMTTDRHVAGYAEPATAWILRNPALPIGARNGTREHPWLIWPLDITHISQAQPGDLDTPMHYNVEGEPEARPPGSDRVQ